jgi:hypothetical protein
MKIYSVDEAFEILRDHKITTHKESVRRWFRAGMIKGISPVSRKEGWHVTEKELNKFIQQRLPENFTTNVVKGVNTTNVVSDEVKEQIRAKMWMELVRKNIFEGFVEIKKSSVRDCIHHKKYSKELETEVWQLCLENSREYHKPRVFYLLDAFKFEGERLMLDKNFELLEEQLMFPIIEYVRAKRT